jgi:bifunctional DNase/RNase
MIYMPKEKRAISWAIVGIWLAVIGFLGNESGASASTPVTLEQKDLLQVKIQRLIQDPSSGQPVVFLADLQEERALLVWIGPCEANALNSELEGTKPPRPQTHDLAERIIHKLNGKIRRVIITHSKDGIYFATLVIETNGTAVEIDARPSDSMVLAQKSRAPIFVSKNLFAKMSIPVKEDKGAEEKYGLSVQELTSSLAQSFSFPSTKGVLISDVRGESQADKDGLKQGDILVEVGGDTVGDVSAFKASLAKAKAPVKVKVFRKGKYLSLTLNLK